MCNISLFFTTDSDTTCKRTFGNRKNWILHLLSHSSSKMYPCDKCPAKFTLKIMSEIHE
jgi:hypothetical protein